MRRFDEALQVLLEGHRKALSRCDMGNAITLAAQFESLTMTPWATKGERMEAMRSIGGRGAWKAGHAERLGIEMFIESCPKQAGIIAREAGIPVFCTATQDVFGL